MEESVVKSIRLPNDMVEEIQREADVSHRSFSKQVLFFLERELTHTETRRD